MTTSYLDFPTPVLFEICWHLQDPQDIANIAACSPTVRERVGQFVRVYSDDTNALKVFNEFPFVDGSQGWLASTLDDFLIEEFTIAFVELNNLDNLAKCKEILKTASTFKKTRVVLGVGIPSEQNEGYVRLPLEENLGMFESVFLASKNVEMSFIKDSEERENKRWADNDHITTSWWNKSKKLFAPSVESLRVQGQENHRSMLNVYDWADVAFPAWELKTLHLERFPAYCITQANISRLESLTIDFNDWEFYTTNSDAFLSKNVYESNSRKHFHQETKYSTLSNLNFPVLTNLELNGIKHMENITLPSLLKLVIKTVPGQTNGIFAQPMIKNVSAPIAKTFSLDVYGDVLPKIMDLDLPQCKQFNFTVVPFVHRLIGSAVVNKVSKVAVPSSVETVICSEGMEHLKEATLTGKVVTSPSPQCGLKTISAA